MSENIVFRVREFLVDCNFNLCGLTGMVLSVHCLHNNLGHADITEEMCLKLLFFECNAPAD